MTARLTPTAGADVENPTHHATLSDGVSTVGLLLVGPNGKLNPSRIQRNSYPRTSTKFATGESKYSDFEVPYSPVTQDDFSSGRGADLFEDDTTRFADSYLVNTEHEKQVILGGMVQPSQAFLAIANYIVWPSSTNTAYSWLALYGTTRYRSYDIGAGTGYSYNIYEIIVTKVGTPGDLTIAIYNSDVSLDPDTELHTVTYSESGAPDLITHHIQVLDGSPYTFAIGPQYHIVVYGNSGDDADNHWLILGAGDSHASAHSSSDGATWTGNASRIYHRISGNAWVAESSITAFKMFEYKRAQYCAVSDGTDTRIYLNGDRGAADANGANKARLNDGTKSWGSNIYAGAIVVIINGPGSEEENPWRRITGNGSNYLTCTPNWKTTHTTSTEYVIVKTDYYQLWHTVSSVLFSDVEVAGEYFYLVSEQNPIYRLREYNNAGAWDKTDVGSELVYARFLRTIQEPTGAVAWGAMNQHPRLGKAVFKSRVPPPGSNNYLYSELGTLAPTDKVWTQRSTTNVTVTKARGGVKIDIASGFTTGLLATKELDAAVDVTGATHVAVELESSVACNSGDLKLLLDDTTYIGQNYLPDVLLHYDSEVGASKVYFYDDSEAAAADKYQQYPDTARSLPFVDTVGNGRMYFTLTTADFVYIGFSKRFNRIKVDIVTANSNAATMTGEYWRGGTAAAGWVDASVTDGTASGGNMLAQDGDITFTTPADWQRGCDTANDDYLDTSLFWIRLSASANLTAVSMIFSLEIDSLPGYIEAYRDLRLMKDGRSSTYDYIWLHTDDFLIVGYSEIFDKINVDVGSVPNAVTASLSAYYFNGSALTALTIDSDGTASGGVTLAQDGDIAFTPPSDWAKLSVEGTAAYYVFLYPSSDLTEGVRINEITVKRDHVVELTIPALTANVPAWCAIAITPKQSPAAPDYTAIRSVGLQLQNDKGAQIVYIHNVKYIVTGDAQQSNLPHIQLPDQSERITNLEGYGEPQELPYIFTEGTFYWIDSSGNLIPSPLGELSTLRSEENALAVNTNDVYLYFNLGPHLEQYHEGQLNDVGPNRDEGLPATRRGVIRKIISLAGGIDVLIDPEDLSTNYWSILSRRNGGWHEVYRSPLGARIHDVFLQVIPGDSVSRLWIALGNDLWWLPVSRASLNPLKDSNFLYTPEGHVITGWITANFLDLQKLYKSLKAYTENLSASEVIHAYYQQESGDLDGTWTEITDTFDASPFEEHDMTTDNSLKARRVRLMFLFRTGDITTTPVLKAWVLEMLRRFEVKNAYSLSFLMPDQPEDLAGVIDFGLLADTDIAQIDTWSDTPTALTFRCNRSAFDNKTVIIEPSGLAATDAEIVGTDPGVRHEAYIGEIAILEI